MWDGSEEVEIKASPETVWTIVTAASIRAGMRKTLTSLKTMAER